MTSRVIVLPMRLGEPGLPVWQVHAVPVPELEGMSLFLARAWVDALGDSGLDMLLSAVAAQPDAGSEEGQLAGTLLAATARPALARSWSSEQTAAFLAEEFRVALHLVLQAEPAARTRAGMRLHRFTGASSRDLFS